MTDEADLIRAVLADPDDDHPRLVYADYLDDVGDAERAAFIRESVLAGHGNQYTGDVFVCRANRPFAGIPAGWADTWGVQIHRGFVRWVMMPAADWLAHGDAIVASHPVRAVTLTTFPRVCAVPSDDEIGYQFGDMNDSGPVYGIAELWQALELPGLMRALRADEVAIGIARIRWPGVVFTLPPPARRVNWADAVAARIRNMPELTGRPVNFEVRPPG